MTIAPYPPMPLIIGSTTFRAAATATDASKALPPSARTFRPARVASGLAELTIPDAPTAGLVGVFSLGSGSEMAAEDEVVGSAVSPPARASSGEVVSSAVFSREAPFEPVG